MTDAERKTISERTEQFDHVTRLIDHLKRFDAALTANPERQALEVTVVAGGGHPITLAIHPHPHGSACHTPMQAIATVVRAAVKVEIVKLEALRQTI